MSRLIVFASLIAFVGCTQTIDEMSYTQLQSYVASMADKCREQGVPESQMEACVQQEVRADQSRRRKQRQFGAALSQASAEYGRSVQANRPVNCTSTGFGNTVRTTCY